jgi:hypothetical protein
MSNILEDVKRGVYREMERLGLTQEQMDEVWEARRPELEECLAHCAGAK